MFRWGFLIWILIVFLFKFVFTLNKGKDNIFCATTKQTGGTEWHGGHWLRKVSGNGKTTKFLEYGKCLETGKRQNPLNTESVWKQENDKILWIQKESGNRKLTKSFEYGKSLETGKWQNPLNTERVWKQGNDKFPWIRKESRNRKMTKPFASAKTSLTRGTDRPFRCLDCKTSLYSVTLMCTVQLTRHVPLCQREYCMNWDRTEEQFNLEVNDISSF